MKRKKQLVHHPPDKLRCRRTNGKGWRCSKLIASNSEAFCQEHYNYHNNNKPTLKSKRKSNTNKGEQVPSDEIRMQRRRSLEQCEDGGLEEESEESLAARILNSSGGNLREESESLEARVSPASDCNDDDDDGGEGGNSSKKKTTKFTQEQKDKMLEFGQRLGWRILKKDEAAVEQFCDEICVNPQLLKSWLHRKKQILARVLNPSSCSGGGLEKKCPRTIFTREQNDKMLEFGKRIGWKIRKKDEDAVEQLCEETGVEDRILRIWLRNKKHRLGFKSQEGRVKSQSKIKDVETRKQCLKVETKSCSEESKFRETMKCHEGSVELENKIMEFIAIEEKYRDGLKEWISCLEDQKTISEREKKAQERITNLRITRLEEEKEVICEREKKAQERITYLEAELRNMGRDDIEKYVLLSTDNRIRECVKRRAEDEVEVCEKRFCDLETRVLRMEEESSTLGYMESHLCGKIELEPCGLQNEVSDHNCDGKFDKKDINKMSKLQAKTNGGTNSSHVVHSQTKEKVLNSNKQIHASAFQGYGSRGGQTNSEIERRNFETRKQCLEVGTKRYSEKSKLGDPGDTFEIESEKNLEVYKKKCHELSVELERKKMECVAIQDKYGDGLKVWTFCLEDKKAIGERGKRAQERITNLRIICLEDKKVMCEREKKAQERIAYLEEVLRKTERNEIEKYAQLSTENRYLEFAKRRAEDELEIWKRKFCELETRVLRMEEEFEDNSTLRCMETRACGNIGLEPGHLQNEVSSQ